MKKRISLLLIISILISMMMPVSAKVLKDDVKGHWAEEVISELLFNGVASGYEDDTFLPDKQINIDEFLVFVTRSLGYYIDVAETGYWAQNVLDKAQELGLLSEMMDNCARPITREEACYIITKAYMVAEKTDAIGASDAMAVTSAYTTAVSSAYQAGIISGYEDGSFRPQGNLTRAEACQVIVKGVAYDPDAGLPFEKLVFTPDQVLEENSPWKFYVAGNGENLRSTYAECKISAENDTVVASYDGTAIIPNITWSKSGVKDEGVYLRPEADHLVATKKGNMILEFTAPRGANYKFSFSCHNVGTDVVGGDGAAVSLSFYGPNNDEDLTSVGSFGIPVSKKQPDEVSYSEVVKLRRGQSVAIRFKANIDGYGDKLKMFYKVETTQEEGKIYTNNGKMGLLPVPPAKKLLQSAPYQKDMVWYGVDGGYFTTEYSKEAHTVLKKYIPNLGSIPQAGKPELISEATKWYTEQGIPTFIQLFGYGDVYKYYTETDSWEYGWDGTVAHPTSGVGLANTGHAASKASKGLWDWTERVARSANRSGFGGYGYMDLVWLYTFGIGNATHNPQTIQAFRDALNGVDEGLLLELDGQDVLYHFEDYAKYYFGSMLTPQDLGLNSWDEYSPGTQAEYLAEPDKDWTPWNALRTALMSYTYLRYAQHIANVNQEEGGMSQVLPNPEDAGNAVDELFLCSLKNLDLMTSEFFRDPYYVDGAYSRYDYFTSRQSEQNSLGIVFECGHGGNAGAYYDNPIAWAIVYESTAGSGMDHVEVDFLVQNRTTLANNGTDKFFRDRYQNGISFALGYNHAREDGVKPYQPQFTAVSSRRVNSPWGDEFAVWEWGSAYRGCPEWMLSKEGYIFDGIAEDGIMRLAPEQKLVVYAPDGPNKYHFDYVMERLESGDYQNLMVNAVNFWRIVDEKWNKKTMQELYPQYAFNELADITLSGNITDLKGNIIAENIHAESTKLWTSEEYEPVLMMGDYPVLVKKQVGNGTMYACCLDPNQVKNYDIVATVYTYVFDQLGIEKNWETIETYGELCEGYEDLGVVNAQGGFEKNASVRLYENGDLKVVGVQTPHARYFCKKEDMLSQQTVPYQLKNAKTTVKARLEPNTEYHYVAMPSGMKGAVVTDGDGFAEFSFENTSYEIFYCLPASTENDVKISERAEKLNVWWDSLSWDGNIQVNDTVAPTTVVSVSGKETDGIYSGSVTVKLNASDTENGSGVSMLSYSVDGGDYVNITNRSVIKAGYITETVSVKEPGKHTICYQATDARGNVESTGTIGFEIR